MQNHFSSAPEQSPRSCYRGNFGSDSLRRSLAFLPAPHGASSLLVFQLTGLGGLALRWQLQLCRLYRGGVVPEFAQAKPRRAASHPSAGEGAARGCQNSLANSRSGATPAAAQQAGRHPPPYARSASFRFWKFGKDSLVTPARTSTTRRAWLSAPKRNHALDCSAQVGARWSTSAYRAHGWRKGSLRGGLDRIAGFATRPT